MERERAIETIRGAVKCKDFLTKSKHGSYICPFCHSGEGPNRSGALKVYNSNTWTCHACGKSGDIIDIYQQEKGLDFNAALSELATLAGITIDTPQNAQKAPFNGNQKSVKGNPQEEANAPKTGQIESQKAITVSNPAADYTEYYKLCRERLTDPAAAAYLNGRGIDLELAQKYGLGFDPEADPANAPGAAPGSYKPHPAPRIIIPTSPSHYIGRRVDAIKEYEKMNPKGGTPGLFNESALYAQDAQEVFILEGAFDALSITIMTAAAVALNSTSNTGRLLEMLEARRTEAILILCPDNDPNPNTVKNVKKAFDELAEGLQRLNISYVFADVNGGYKDANDFLVADFDGLFDAVSDAVNAAQQERKRLQKEEEERRQRTGAAMIDSFLSDAKSRKYEPVPTGITDIDRAIGGGFIRQQIINLGAAPGGGKTAFAQWIFERMASKGQPCIYLNLEMSRQQMIARSLARIASINGTRLRVTDILQGYKWTQEQEEAITEAADIYKQTIAPNMIYNPDGISANLTAILNYIEEEAARAEILKMPVPFVVLDYLQILTGDPREEEVAIIKRAVSSLKAFAIKHNTVVFTIIAHNRGANASGTITMESGRDTSALEYGADLQMGLTFTKCLKREGQTEKKPDELTPEERKYITLKITKSRFAAAGLEVDLIFDGETMQYKQIDQDAGQWEQAGLDFSIPFTVI